MSLAQSLPIAATGHVAAGVAAAYWRAGTKHVRFARANLALALPNVAEREREAIGRASIQNFARCVLDLARSEAWSLDEVLAMHTIEGQDHLDRALARGRGVIILAPHMGNFELGIRALSACGVKVTAVARRARNPLVDAWLRRHRQEGGAEVIDHRGAARGILQALRRGRAVPLLNDQYVRREHGVWAPFFALRASTSPSAAILSQRSGAPVVPMYTLRTGLDEHRIVIEPAIDPGPGRAPSRHDVIARTTAFNRWLERVIRAHPEQWLWAHRRFRHSPDLETPPYA